MSHQNYDFERIEQFLEGTLQGRELDAFRQRLASDPDFRRAVEFHRDVLAGIKAYYEAPLMEKFRQWNEKIKKEAPEPALIPFWRQRRTWLAAAALLLLIAFAFLLKTYLPTSTHQQLLAESINAAPESHWETRADNAAPLLDSAFRFYDQQQYTESLLYFEKALNIQAPNPEILFFEGYALLRTGQTGRAIQNFEAVIGQGNTSYLRPARWYLALAYLKAKEVQKARALLIQIQQDSGSSYQEKAGRLLETLTVKGQVGCTKGNQGKKQENEKLKGGQPEDEILSPPLAADALAEGAIDTLQAHRYFTLAGAFKDSLDYDSAAVYYQKAGQLFEGQACWERFVQAYNEVGKCYRKSANYKEAFQYLEKALEGGKSHLGEYHPGVADSYHNVGSVYTGQGLYDQALEYCQKALNIRSHNLGNEHPKVAISFNKIGNIYYYKGLYDEALKYYQKALDIRVNSLGDSHSVVAASYNNIGLVYKAQGLYNQALKYYQKAFNSSINNLADSHPDMASRYHSLGLVYKTLGLYGQALEHLQKALSIWNSSLGDDHPWVAMAYSGTGIVYYYQGLYDKALEDYEKALDILIDRFGDAHPKVADTYNNMGIIYWKQGLYDKALGCYQKAFDIWADGQKGTRMAYFQNNIGLIYHKQGLYDEALKHYQKALNIKINILGYTHPSVAETYINVGIAYAEQGLYNKALEYYQKTLNIRINRLGDSHPDLADTYNSISSVYEKQYLFDKALTFRQKALLNLYDDFKDPDIYTNPPSLEASSRPFLLEILTSKATTLKNCFINQSKNKKDLHFALETYKLAAILIDSMRYSVEEENTKQILGEQSMPTYEGGIETALMLYQQTDSLKYLHHAFHFAEKSKAFTLLEAIKTHHAQAFAGIPDSLVEREIVLKAQIARHQKVILDAQQEKDSAKVQLHQDFLFEDKQVYRSLIRWLETEYPKYYRLKYDIKTIGVEALQEKVLTSDDALLEYFLGDSAVYVFAINKTDAKIWKLDRDSALDKQVKQYRDALSGNKPHLDSFIVSASRLYKALLRPAEELFNGKHLIIVPDGELSYFPFEALLRRKPVSSDASWKELEYLQKTHSVSYAYSGTLLQEAVEQPVPREGLEYLAFAPSFNSWTEVKPDNITNASTIAMEDRLVELKGAKKEVAMLSKYVRGKALTGAGASERAFKEQASNYGFIYLATHAFLDDEHPMNSHLFFSRPTDTLEDGKLHAFELYNMKLNAKIAVLSACNTGFGKLQRGEGVASLARAFAYAGCPSTIMSLWSVPDRETAGLMEPFCQALADGKAIDESLQNAKLQYLEAADEIRAHPYFWAGFVVTGNVEAVSLKAPGNKWYAWLAAFLLLFPAIWLYQKNRKGSQLASN